MISFKSQGDFKKTTTFLKKIVNRKYLDRLNEYGKRGVDALASATPKDTGLTASSWSYEVITDKNSARVVWSNSNIQGGVNIAVILQYGHGTRNGGYVVGRDYINPAIRPIFDQMVSSTWKEVTDG